MDYNRIIVISSTLFVFLAFSLKTRLSFHATNIVDFHSEKCPFCLGSSFCEHIDNLHIEITLVDYVLGFFNHKYVYYGLINDRPVVIKRLVHKDEISVFESEIVSISNDFSRLSNADFYERSLLLLNHSFSDPSYKLRLCPTLNSAHKLFDPILPDNKFINIWTSLYLSPESLLLQLLKKSKGWPVPEYIGSCGRILIVERCGKTIENYLHHPWLFRLHIVEQLLLAAYNFTFSDPHFSFYFRDVSYSNIVLDSALKPRIVDLEHVIVVDKNTSIKDQPSSWQEDHQTEDIYCEECMMYSPQKICSHRISDHNFYAICKEFLHSIYHKDLGLLHSPPTADYTSSVMERLKYYVKECINPTKHNTRFEMVNHFLKLSLELKVMGNFSIDSAIRLV